MRHRAEKALACFGVLALILGAGCNKDEGIEVSAQDAAALQKKQAEAVEKQIADIQNDPKMPAAQKSMIINQIKAGAARASAGAQSGQSGASKK